jgi:hypothetical protein
MEFVRMSILSRSLLATAAVVVMTWNLPAHALSMHECSAKYHAAQTAKTLNGMSWKEFRRVRAGRRRGRCSCGTVRAQHR